jgi:hypothetical protein
VGACQLHGLSDAEKLLGFLPKPWEFQVKIGDNGARVYYFRNVVTEEETMEDPRLVQLPTDWEACSVGECADELDRKTWFRNISTGETLNSDPRMLPAALRAQGVKVEKFQLI